MASRPMSRQEEEQFPSDSGTALLLIHEDPEYLQRYSLLLQENGYRVRACPAHTEALQILNSERFDFVVVSQGSSSFEARRVLEQATERNPHLPVLVVARNLDMNCYLEAVQLGAVDYLIEPITPADILRIVEGHVRPLTKAA